MTAPQVLAKLTPEMRSTFLDAFRKEHSIRDCVSTSTELDAAIREVTGLSGIPRGAITEMTGKGSVGVSTTVLEMLREFLHQDLYCAYIDVSGSLDVVRAHENGVALERMLWIRGSGELDACLTVTDLLVQAGGFGVIVLDIKDIPARQLNQVPQAYWHKLRLALEPTASICFVLSDQGVVKSSAALTLEVKRKKVVRKGAVMESLESEMAPRKGVKSVGVLARVKSA